MNEGIDNTIVSGRITREKMHPFLFSLIQMTMKSPLATAAAEEESMLRKASTMSRDEHIPLSIAGTGTGREIPQAKPHHAGSLRAMAMCELNLSGYQLIAGCVCFLGAAKLFLWALLKLWVFEP